MFDELPEILTVKDLAKALQLSRSQVYDLTRKRGQLRNELPLPVIRINGNVRFLRSDIAAWLDKLSKQGGSAS